MRSDATPNKILLGFKRCVFETFNDAKWRELSLEIDCEEFIECDDRLLRSLYCGDDDYEGRAMIVLENILREHPEKIPDIERFVKLEKWLYDNDPSLYADLYDGDSQPLKDVETIGRIHNNFEVNKQVDRIKRSLRDDDTLLAIGSAKDLLESVMKSILDDFEIPYSKNDGVPTLLKKTQCVLDIDPKDMDGESVHAQKIKRILSNFGQIVIGITELRNLVGNRSWPYNYSRNFI